METRSIGSLSVTIVGIGCNNFGGRIDEERSAEVVHAALEEGINFFDTADVYGGTLSEEFLGRALGPRRGEAIIATKFGNAIDDEHRGAKPDYVKRACEDSLRRLGTDHIDLYQLHSPDPSTPLSDTLAALNALVEEGKVLELGCSNFTIDQLREAETMLGPTAAGFVSVQNQYSLLRREDGADVLPFCEEAGISYLPFFPLASGLLTGKYRRGEDLPEGARITAMNEERRLRLVNDHNLDVVESLIAFGAAHDASLLEIAIARLLAERPIASVIGGATSAIQVRENAAAALRRLTDEEIAEVDKIVPIPSCPS